AIELARALPIDVPTPSHREQVRTALLARLDGVTAPIESPHRFAVRRAAAEPRLAIASRRSLWAGSAIALAMAAGVAAYFALRDEPRATKAAIESSPDARFAAISRLPDEVIRLHDGTLVLDVEHLDGGERFRVAVGG